MGQRAVALNLHQLGGFLDLIRISLRKDMQEQDMQNNVVKKNSDQLWRAYRTSFQQFAAQASLLHSDSPELPDRFFELQHQLEEARATYRAARNQLAISLLPPKDQSGPKQDGCEMVLCPACC